MPESNSEPRLSVLRLQQQCSSTHDALRGNVSSLSPSERCAQISSLVDSITKAWQDGVLTKADVEPELRTVWLCFCRTGMITPAGEQQALLSFFKSILAYRTPSSADAVSVRDYEDVGVALWTNLPYFKSVAEEMLQHTFVAEFNTPEATDTPQRGKEIPVRDAQWTNLNHLLARISLPPESLYDLRLCCLWNLHAILEVDSVEVSMPMLKVLNLWLGGHIHWLQLQILRAHSETSPPVPDETGGILVDLSRVRIWKSRLQEIRDANSSTPTLKFYADAALQLLEVGTADVHGWDTTQSAGDGGNLQTDSQKSRLRQLFTRRTER